MKNKMHRNSFLDKIIDDVITPTYSFSFDGYHTPKTADDAKPIILEYKEGLRKYKSFYEDLLEIMKAHPTFEIKNEYYPFSIRDNSITKDSEIYQYLYNVSDGYIYNTKYINVRALEIFIMNINSILDTDIDEYIKFYNENRYNNALV